MAGMLRESLIDSIEANSARERRSGVPQRAQTRARVATLHGAKYPGPKLALDRFARRHSHLRINRAATMSATLRSAAILVVYALAIVAARQAQARRGLQRTQDDEQSDKFRAYGLRNLGAHHASEGLSYSDRTPVGLRRAIVELLEQDTRDESEIDDDSSELSKRSTAAANQVSSGRNLNYLVSPISNQIILDEEREFAKSIGDSLSEKYNTIWNHGGAEPLGASGQAALECRTIRTSVELTKDDVDKSSGQVVRNCKGLVSLNRCEGSCSSSVLPSIKSRNGFKKVMLKIRKFCFANNSI